MRKYIDADELRAMMYHEAFEEDSDLQRWDSGCWIRYKMFKNVLEQIEPADVAEIVKCRDCDHWNGETHGCTRNPSVEAWFESDYCSYGEREDG